jgi:hypothetical protein
LCILDQKNNNISEETKEEYFPIEFKDTKNCLYFVEYYECEILHKYNTNDIKQKYGNTNTFAMKIFSMFHKCIPFKVYGHTNANKDEYEYPDVPKEINDIEDIQEIKKIIDKCNGEQKYFIIEFDNYCFD